MFLAMFRRYVRTNNETTKRITKVCPALSNIVYVDVLLSSGLGGSRCNPTGRAARAAKRVMSRSSQSPSRVELAGTSGILGRAAEAPAFDFEEEGAVSSSSGSDQEPAEALGGPGKKPVVRAAAAEVPDLDDPDVTLDGLHPVCCVCGAHSGEVSLVCCVCV